MICGRNQQSLTLAQQKHPQLLVYCCDVSKEEGLSGLLAMMNSHFSTLDVLINNAAIQQTFDYLNPQEQTETIATEININLIAPMRLTHCVLPKMAGIKKAAIINITSALAFAPKPSTPGYCAAKAGLRSFSRSLRHQLSTQNIRVIEIIPALVETKMTQNNHSHGKISPQRLVKDTVKAIRKGKNTVYIEKARWLYLIYRIWPRLAFRIMQHA